jgi:2-polyprenyl-3-methyl-5-hydroxy-6-metoxy-1,4-benzoquinol methylase
MASDPAERHTGDVPTSPAVARTLAHVGEPEIRSPSRIGFLGVALRRLVRRLTRFQWRHQSEFNRGALDALIVHDAQVQALAGQVAALSRALEQVVTEGLPALGQQIGGLSRSLEAVIAETLPQLGGQVGSLSGSLEAVVSETLPQLGGQVGALSASLEQVVSSSVPRLGGQVGELSRTLEAVVGDSLPALGGQLGLVDRSVQQLQEAFADVHNGMFAQGRHLDDLATSLADLREEIEAGRGADEELRGEAERLEAAFAELRERWRPNLQFDSFDFARRHRGTEDDLIAHMTKYASQFGGVQRVLDVGCGRGEFLDACAQVGVGSYGIDVDPDMVSRCRMKGLEVYQADVLEHLRALEDRSLDGIFSSQVVEHMTAAELFDFVQLAAAKMRRGAAIILETINPDTFTALRWFWMDPTHRQPVPPAMLRFLLEGAGFTLRDVLYTSPLPEQEALERLPEGSVSAAGLALEPLRSYNRNVEKLNRVLFGEQDYAIIAER